MHCRNALWIFQRISIHQSRPGRMIKFEASVRRLLPIQKIFMEFYFQKWTFVKRRFILFFKKIILEENIKISFYIYVEI